MSSKLTFLFFTSKHVFLLKVQKIASGNCMHPCLECYQFSKQTIAVTFHLFLYQYNCCIMNYGANIACEYNHKTKYFLVSWFSPFWAVMTAFILLRVLLEISILGDTNTKGNLLHMSRHWVYSNCDTEKHTFFYSVHGCLRNSIF